MRRFALVPVVALALVAACSRHAGKFTPRQYPDGAAGLKLLWTDILDAARNDDRERVHDLMATMILTDAELARLFGPARAQALKPRYEQLIGTLVNRGAVELVAQEYEKKYDTVDAFADDHEEHVQAILAEPHPLWSVRLRKASDKLGLRYDFFVYLDGKWKTGNQLDKFIDVQKPDK